MTQYSDRPRWWFFMAAILIALAAGFFAYNAGVSHGAAVAAVQAQAPAAGTYPYPYPYAYGWHRPWGFGFGPLFFLLLFFLFFRGCWGWGGPWRRHWYYEDRARMKEEPSGDNPGRG